MAADFVEVCAGAFEAIGMPAGVTRKVFSLPERWLKPYWRAFVVYERSRAVSAAALLFSHGIAGIYWVATSADARGKGYGELVTRHVSHDAFKSGARCVILQASPFGEPIYRKLGFREFTRYPLFLSPHA
jgi:ribosomal protein S18 acetylase RimI-like enzyme